MTIKELFKINENMSVNSNVQVLGNFGVVFFEGKLSEFIEKNEGLYAFHNIVSFKQILDPGKDQNDSCFEITIW